MSASTAARRSRRRSTRSRCRVRWTFTFRTRFDGLSAIAERDEVYFRFRWTLQRRARAFGDRFTLKTRGGAQENSVRLDGSPAPPRQAGAPSRPAAGPRAARSSPPPRRCSRAGGVQSRAPCADVAERAGVGVGEPRYHHFPDKRALLLALIDDWGDRELARARDAIDMARLFGSDPRAAFGDDLRARYERLRREGSFYLVLLELAERDGDVRTRLSRINQVAVERVRDLLALGQRRGVVRPELDPLAAAFLVRHSIRTAATEVFVHRMADPAPEHVLAGLIDMICRYIFVEEPG